MDIFAGASLIWYHDRTEINRTIEFCRSFSLPSETTDITYTCYLYVHSEYALYLNGVFVNSGIFRGYEDARYYDTLDVTSYLHPGVNEFCLIVYSQGEDSFTVRHYPPCALFVLMKELPSGKTESILRSEPGFPVRRDLRFKTDVPKISPQLSYSFDFDETIQPEAFEPAVSCEPMAAVLPFLSPRPVKKLDILPVSSSRLILTGSFQDTGSDPTPAIRMASSDLEISRPEESISLPSEEGAEFSAGDASGICLIAELPAHTVGLLSLELELEEDTDLIIGWGEHLEDGHVRTFIHGRNFAAHLRLSAGRRTFFYPLKRIAARYLQLHLYTTHAQIYSLGIRETIYPLSYTAPFEPKDPLHKRIYETCLKTLRDCMHEHYEDCPWREQALYTMDSRNQMLCGYFAFHEYAFPAASLQLIAKSLREDGLLELISPGKADITIPSFTYIYLIQCAEYLRYSKDAGTIKELLPVLFTIADRMISRIDETGLISRYPGQEYWNFYEWQDGLSGDKRTLPTDSPIYDAPLNAFAVLALQSLLEILTALNEKTASFEEAISKIRSSYHSVFFDQRKGVYTSFVGKDVSPHYAELTQALSLLAGLVSPEKEEEILEALAGHRSKLIPITLSHSIFKYEALFLRPERYASYVFERIAEDYGYMLSRGADTFWETIEGASAFGNAGSLCHGWSAVPVYFYRKNWQNTPIL
ncbi:MAG: hypothetical protein J5589_12730 [Firmicutes bacterium]|nr:hypothetical protein [Bacillota bacterium]